MDLNELLTPRVKIVIEGYGEPIAPEIYQEHVDAQSTQDLIALVQAKGGVILVGGFVTKTGPAFASQGALFITCAQDGNRILE